ncbi:hypothetical protein [Streptomyces sp. NBC_01306]|uniref:hypothetical protein n=1 Tax=Streptomyces sp. NBC_01306 TaxID=2903819 RepID=UPI0022553D39|nr:hypothetical protein [Streptomyces sp. NBC_01306]MCX4724649.1 hypothetical protein [Streptomyces sp. NBC_01306]
MGTMILGPLALAGCGWLAQRQGTLVMLLSAFLAMIVLCIAWAMCGAGPGACVAALGFALMLFLGPALNDYVMGQRGVRHDAVISGVDSYHRKHGDDGYTCGVKRIDVARSAVYSVDDDSGCSKNSRPGQRVTLVEDPTGWLYPRLAGSVNGLSAGMLWTCAGLCAGMESFMLYGRLRRRV